MYSISAGSAYTTLMMSWSKQKLLVFASYFFRTERRKKDNIAQYNTSNYYLRSVSMRNSKRWICFSIFVDKFPNGLF